MKTRLNKRMHKKKILVPSFDFKPQLGGVAHYAQELLLTFKKSYHCEITIIARDIPGATTYDQTSPFHIARVKTPDMALLALPQWIWAVKKMIKQTKPDLIFCPLWFPDASATYIATFLSSQKIPYVIAAHAMELLESCENLKQTLRKNLLSSLKTATFQHSQKIFPVSAYTAQILQKQMNISPEKIVVASNGVNLSTFAQTTPPHDRFFHQKKLLLTVSRLRPYKGIDMVLKSIAPLIQQGMDLHYNVVGVGNDLSRLQKITTDLNIQNHVSFLGALSEKEIIQLYRESDLFILLSRHEGTDVEGFGLVFLEAAACGLPSLGGRSGGIPDAIDEGKTGWLVAPESLSEITNKLRGLLTTPNLLNEASQQCLRHVQNHTWSVTAQKIQESLHGS